jgi:hypothetical protein
LRDPGNLLKYAEECLQRSWDVQDEEQKRLLRETADAWKAMAREVVRMNEFAEKSADVSRALRQARVVSTSASVPGHRSGEPR